VEVSEHYLHQPLIPPMSGLFQAIQDFAEMTDKVLVAWESEARGLGHVDDLVRSEYSIEIGTFDVNLMDLIIFTGGNSKDGSDQCKPCNWSKRVEVVDARYL
jgi:hypothetical protein